MSTVLVLVAALCAACQPRLGEFEVTNQTDETLVLWDVAIAPGATQEFEIEPPDCLELVLFSADAEHQAVVEDVCEDDRVKITASALAPAEAATVVNETTEPLEVRYVGWASIRSEPLGPGEEVRIPLLPTEAACGQDDDQRRTLVVYRQGEPDDGEVLARYWDEVCAGTRWVLDDAALLEGAPATAMITNRTAATLRVWPGGEAGDTWTAAVVIQPDSTVQLQVAYPRDGCQIVVIHGVAEDADEDTPLRDDLTTTCGGELVLTAADLVHPGEDGGARG